MAVAEKAGGPEPSRKDGGRNFRAICKRLAFRLENARAFIPGDLVLAFLQSGGDRRGAFPKAMRIRPFKRCKARWRRFCAICKRLACRLENARPSASKTTVLPLPDTLASTSLQSGGDRRGAFPKAMRIRPFKRGVVR